MKVQAAQRFKGIHLVWARWLIDTTATWCRQTEADYSLESELDPPPVLRFPENASSTFIPNSLADGILKTYSQIGSSTSGAGIGTTTMVAEEQDEEDDKVDVAAINWADAAREVDDFLNETDGDNDGEEEDDDDDDESDFDRPASNKRVRVTTDSEDDSARSDMEGTRIDKGKGKATIHSKTKPIIPTESALSKRIKKSNSRTSRLRVSFPSTSDSLKEAEEDLIPARPLPATVKRSGAASEEIHAASQDGSSLGSDDEAFLASMAADVWS